MALAGSPERGAAVMSLTQSPGELMYGSDVSALRALPGADRWLWRAESKKSGTSGLSEAMVRFAARFEMARSVEDVLARRSRLLFLDARLAASVSDEVAALLAEELGATFDATASAAAFRVLAKAYLTLP